MGHQVPNKKTKNLKGGFYVTIKLQTSKSKQ